MKRKPTPKNIRDTEYALERRRFWLAEAERKMSRQRVIAFWRKAVAEAEQELARLREELSRPPGRANGRGRG